MSAIPGMLGLDSGASGTGFASPQSANLLQPVSMEQVNQSATGTNNSLASQQALLQALQSQNGINNQSNVYNQLQGVASGAGPNPAQAQYQQNVQDLAKQQAGAISSIKGISPALQARMISQQGAAAGQNAAAAGGANLAAQQLGALNAAGNIAGQQVGNQIGATATNTQANLQNQSNLLGAMGQFNSSQVANQSNLNSTNAGLAQQGMQNQQKFIGGGLNAIGGAIGLAHGGEVPGSGPQSNCGKHLAMKKGGAVPGKAATAGDSAQNDTVDAKLSPGEIVLPRSVVNSKKPSAAAAKFVEAVLAKKGKKK